MTKVRSLALALVTFFVLLPVFNGVSAQYDTNTVLPTYQEGGEIYGINITASQKVTFSPQGCESIDKVTIEAKNPINGQVFLKALTANPKKDQDNLQNVFEFCQVELRNINQSDIKTVTVEVKVRKSWLDDNKITADQISFYTFDNNANKYVAESTTRKSDSTLYNYYEAQASNFPYWAVAKSPNSFLGLNFLNPGLLLLCCIIALILIILIALLLASRRRSTTDTQNI